MYGIAPTRAIPERTASAVLFFLLLSAGMAAQAQQAVYRCGQEYTNAPREPGLCEPLAPQAITVINGTRPAPSLAVAPVSVPTRSTKPDPVAAETSSPGQPLTLAVPARTPDVQQSERDAQARTILTQELDKARAQLAQLGFVTQRGKLVGLRSGQSHDQGLRVDKIVGQMRVMQSAPGQAQSIFERGVDKAHTALALHHGHGRGQQVKGLESIGFAHGVRRLV